MFIASFALYVQRWAATLRWLAGAVVATCLLACTAQSDTSSATDSSGPMIQISEDSVISLRGETLTDADTLARPSKIVTAGPYLVVKDSHGNPPVHIIRASDGAYVSSLGTPGQGPGEFTGSGAWSFDVVSHDPPRLWIYDLSALRLTYVDLEGYVNGSFALGERILNLNIGFTPTSPVWLGDSLLVSPGFLTEPRRLAQFSPEGDYLGAVGVSPPPRDGVPIAVLQHAYQSRMKPRPGDRSLLALGTFYADRIEIYHADGTRKRLVQGPANFDPIFNVAPYQGQPARQSTDETRNGYTDLATTKDHIYALYSGRRRDKGGPYGTSVRVFDWDGTLQRVYNLNAAALGIAVDPDGTTLYATQRYPDLEITRYALAPSP